MHRILCAALLLTSTLGPAMAGAPGFGYSREHRPDVVFPGKRVHRSPYPMSQASASIWHSDACFRDCTGHAAWKFEACIRKSPADDCRSRLDATDRVCLVSCRLQGGPLLNITD